MFPRIIYVCATIIALAVETQAQESIELLDETQLKLTTHQTMVLENIKKQPTTNSIRLFRFRNLATIKDAASMNLTIPTLGALNFQKKRGQSKSPDEWTWSGSFKDDRGDIFISATKGNVYGTIRYDYDIFTIVPLGDAIHSLIEIDPTKLPKDEPDEWNLPSQNQKDQKRLFLKENVTNTLATIDIMIVYTSAVASHSGDIDGFVNACVNSLSDGLENSNATPQVNNLYSVEVEYTESGSVITDNDRLISTNDGYMDDIHALRDQYGADIVVLLVDFDNNGVAGAAAGIGPSSSYAFAVSVANYAVGNYTFAHEVGHLIGCRHDDDQSGSYNHGYKYSSGYWRTIMASYDPNVIRINYWSSPNNTYGGIPMGTTNWNNNTRVWNENASTVAAFKDRPLSVSIGGPACIAKYSGSHTWYANVSGGNGSYSYQWNSTKESGVIGTGSSVTKSYGPGFTLYLSVTSGSSTVSASLHVTECSGGGETKAVSTNKGKILPDKFELLNNFPNPFNPSTTIRFGLPSSSNVSLKIYNIQGEEVRTLVGDYLNGGYYDIVWDGNDEAGNKVASGIYVYRLQAGNFIQSKKMTYIK